jgi:hypothetical protein
MDLFRSGTPPLLLVVLALNGWMAGSILACNTLYFACNVDDDVGVYNYLIP